MTKKSKAILTIVAIVLLLFGWWISDILIGYYQFKQICKKEGGLRSYAKVEPNVGWWAEHEPTARDIVSSYPTVSFARYRADDGIWKDVRYKGGNPWWSESYTIINADETKRPRYRLNNKLESVTNAIRLRKRIYKLSDELSGQVIFQTTQFIFTWTTPENTLLGSSDTVVCPAYKDVLSSTQLFLKSTHQSKD